MTELHHGKAFLQHLLLFFHIISVFVISFNTPIHWIPELDAKSLWAVSVLDTIAQVPLRDTWHSLTAEDTVALFDRCLGQILARLCE
jgi:hypothetical protein